MKKIFKRILLIISIIAGLLIIVALGFYIRFNRATKSMTPAETSSLNDTVWCIKDKFVNSFIFKGQNGYLLVDAGFSAGNFEKELNKTGLKPGQITNILLTHTDGDHIGAMKLFKNAETYMHRDEEQMINGTNGKMKFIRLKWKYGHYSLLDSNDTLTLDGLKIRILHTPGHTPGSSCYVINDDYFCTGDNLILKDNMYEHFVELFNMNTPEQTESIKSLPAPDNFKYILMAHHGVIKMSE